MLWILGQHPTNERTPRTCILQEMISVVANAPNAATGAQILNTIKRDFLPGANSSAYRMLTGSDDSIFG